MCVETAHKDWNRVCQNARQSAPDLELRASNPSHRLLIYQTKTGPLSASLPLCARHLPGGGIEAVEEVGRGDHEDQGCEPLLVVVPAGLVPDRVWDRVGPIGETGGSLGEREGGTFGVGEVGCLPPGRHGEEALVCFACLLGAACARVNAEAAAIDLARAQVDKLKRSEEHTSELQSHVNLVCRLLLEKKKKTQ